MDHFHPLYNIENRNYLNEGNELNMLNSFIETMSKSESIFAEKEDGTKVNYYIFPEFEVHLNIIPAGTIQGWHMHNDIEEILIVNDGEIRVETIVDNKKKYKNCQKGELIRMNQSLHRILNLQNHEAAFSVFRFVPQGIDHREKIKNDKKSYTDDEVEAMLKRM
ncbi:cupin domain-containing protein [Enterococcus wangshanyuanii]|nr:cupin domain-containing protein [Enterococcus wangshanyuanii]